MEATFTKLMKDRYLKKVSLSGVTIREKTRCTYMYFKEPYDEHSGEGFQVSEGWFS